MYGAQPVNHLIDAIQTLLKDFTSMLPMKTKTRLEVDPPRTQATFKRWTTWNSGASLNWSQDTVFNKFGKLEVVSTVDRRSEPPYRRTKKFIRDNGGPFLVNRVEVKRDVGFLNATTQPALGYYHYELLGNAMLDTDSVGIYIPYTITGDYLKGKMAYSPFNDDLATYGAKAYARMTPLNPSASMGQALAEAFRDGLPILPLLTVLKRRHLKLKDVGKAYLGLQFGWVPFLHDLQDLYHTVNAIDSRIQQIVRDNGRPIRRKCTLRKNVESHTNKYGPYGMSIPAYGTLDGNPDAFSSYWDRAVTVSKYDRIWASGQFRYYLPGELRSVNWPSSAVRALFDAQITPALLWEVMPYSWLIDWFADVDSLIRNWQSNGMAELLTDYCYLMRHQRQVTQVVARVPQRSIQSSFPGAPFVRTSALNLQTSIIEERKERIAASPFGFGLHLNDLSVKQAMILGALGLSRQNFV